MSDGDRVSTNRAPPGPVDRWWAIKLLEAQVDAFVELAGDLDEDAWQQPTAHAGWTVHEVLAHVTGQIQELANFGTFITRVRAARQRYPDRFWLDAHDRVQLDELVPIAPAGLIAELARRAPVAARILRGVPGSVRSLPVSTLVPWLRLPDDRLGYLHDVLLPRNIWLARLDVAEAVGREHRFDDHDRTIVAQVVRDITHQWREAPVTVELTGPAGGFWTIGTGPPTAAVRVAAIGLVRHLAGRLGPALAIDGDAAVVTAMTRLNLMF